MSPRVTRAAKEGIAPSTSRRRPPLPGRGKKGAAAADPDAAQNGAAAPSSGARDDTVEAGAPIIANGARWAEMQRSAATAAPHVAMPHLMGQPAYARPPRPLATETPRPFDPDDLPLEAFRSDDDRLAAEELARQGAIHQNGTMRPSTVGGLRGIADRFFGSRG